MSLSETDCSFFFEKRCFSNCQAKIHVENTDLFACKEQLAAYSDFFTKLFFGSFKEAQDTGEISIEDESAADVLSFLSCLLPHPVTEDITELTLPTLIRLADKFQTPELKKKCVQFLRSYLPFCEPQKRMDLLTYCDQYHIPEGVKLCLPYCKQLSLITLQSYHDKVDRGVIACLYAAKLNTTLENIPMIASQVSSNELKASVPCFFCNQLATSLFKCCKRVVCSQCKPEFHKCKAGESYLCSSCGVVCLLRKDVPGCKCLGGCFEEVLLQK